jgi:HPt (histidine-containing phosphotransfer) domain-containing protein
MDLEPKSQTGAPVSSQASKVDRDSVVVESLVADLIPWFLENRNKEIGILEEASAKGDFETTRHIGHTLKGTSGGYGFIYLGELGGLLEAESKLANKARVIEIIQNMKDHLGRVQITYSPD